ncbi:protein TASOR 2 [Apteryx mantelli]|uniref:Protein TASOR 2 n=1 Tax=Apteryx mantelli TaxID=2696672 RepID=A0ABM4ESW9_9AVES
MGERRDGATAAGGTGLHPESEESSSLLQTAVSVLQSSYLDCTSRDGFQYSQAILVENDVFLNELKAFAQAKEAAGYSQEELEETFAFLLFDNEEEAKEVCQIGLRINTSSISTLGDPAKGVYISKYADYLHPRPWYHGKSGYIVIFKLIKGKVKAVCENYTTSYTCPSPGYDCHIAVSRNNISSKTSHFQAFELSQYYVYEVSDGGIAERPRQICPYIVIACQYREPNGMPVLARESLPELNHKASYCPWRGQLSIRGQLLCNIALRTPYSSTIPAQLPPNLDINHVMGLSDLKKKLPEAAFGKSNYVEKEVCFQGIYFSLYEVEISNKDHHKMDELLQNLKEKDLAIIKYLQDQGVLILLTSAALTRDDAFDPEEPVSLLALFLFASSRSVCLRATSHQHLLHELSHVHARPGFHRRGCRGAVLGRARRHRALAGPRAEPTRFAMPSKHRVKAVGFEPADLEMRASFDVCTYILSGNSLFLRDPRKKRACKSGDDVVMTRRCGLQMPLRPEFSRPDLKDLTAVDRRDPKAEREDSDISLKIASVLPGLQYAIQKATSSSGEDAVGTSVRIKQHFQEFAKLDQNAQPTSGQNSRAPLSSLLSPAEDEGTNPFKKCSERSFSQLQRYLSNPGSYTLEMSAALGCLAGAVQSLCCNAEAVCNADSSSVVPPDPVPPGAAAEIKVKSETPKPAVGPNQGGKGTAADGNSAGKLRVRQSKRKSSRAVVSSTRKKWSPLKMQMHPIVADGSRNRKATKKKKINIAFSFPKKPGLAANANEPMLKLANLQFPHRRKRGAEVLSAEFVHKTQSEPVPKGTSAPGDPGVETKRPKTLKKPDVKKVPSAQPAPKPAKSKMMKSVASSPSKPQAKKQAESERKEPFSVLPSEGLCKSQGAASETRALYPSGVAAAEDIGLRGDDYESHALNLLADLALGSCIPPLIPADGAAAAVSCSPSKEQRSHRKPKPSRVAFDHEYHRVDKLAKGGGSPSKASPNHKLPSAGKTDFKKDSAPTPGEKSPGIFSKKNSLSPSSSKTRALPPKEAQEPAEVNKHSFISSEHSYASQMPEHPRKHTHPRGIPYPGPAPSRNGARNVRPGPLVGKVLPFRHQQNSTHHQQRPFEAVVVRPRGGALSHRPKEDFAKSHTVNNCGGSVKVTCRWEAEYLFHLDSRYTNDALEKTVIRALHGPWDPDLPDDVEEMKLILHMWVALFYSKPSKLLSSTRKVVEHSNPEKYVSINSTGDFFELSDDSEDCFGLETCPADSQSDPDQTPSSFPEPSARYQGPFRPEEGPADSQADADRTHSVVDSTVSSSLGELPSGEEPSSTSCPKSPSLAERADESNLAVEDGWPAVAPGERVHDVPAVAAEEPPREEPLDATIAPDPSDELGDASRPPSAPDRENPHDGDLNVRRDSRSSTPCTRHGRGEQLESGCPGPPEERGSAGGGRRCTPVGESGWAAGNGPRPACDSMPVEASPRSAKPDRPGGEGRESQDSSGRGEREEEEMEEEKKEEEDSGCESVVLGPLDLVSSEGSNADTEHRDRETTPVSSAHPEDPAVPGEGPAPGPAALASPCQHGLMPALSAATGPSETAPSPCALPEPREAPDTPGVETNGVDLVHEAGPSDGGLSCDGGLMPDPSLLRGAQAVGVPAAAVTGSVSPSGEVRGAGLELSDGDRAPSAETRAPAESEAAGAAGLEPPGGRGPSLALSADSGPVHLAPLDGATGLGAPLEKQEATVDIPAPPPSGLGEGGCLSRRCRGDFCADLASLSSDEPNREGNELPVGQQPSGSSAGRTDVLGEPPAADEDQVFSFDRAALGGDAEAGKSGEVRLVAGKPPGSSPTEVPGPGDPGSAPPSPSQLDSAARARTETHCPAPAPDGTPRSRYVAQVQPGARAGRESPGGHTDAAGRCEEGPVPREELDGGSGISPASPAPFVPLGECGAARDRSELGTEESGAFADLHRAVSEQGEGEIPDLPFPASLPHAHQESGQSLELSDAGDVSDVLLRAKLFPSGDGRGGWTYEKPLYGSSSGDSDQEHFGGTICPPLKSWGSSSTKSTDAADASTGCDSSSVSSEHTEGRSEAWSSPGAREGWSRVEPHGPGDGSSRHVPPYVSITDNRGVPRDYLNFTVTRKHRDGAGILQPAKRRSRRAGQLHLLRSLVGTWRGFEEATQDTLDLERLRFHYKLKQILRSRKTPFPTSGSISPKDFPPRLKAEPCPGGDALAPRSRTPLQVTLLPAAARSGVAAPSRDCAAPVHLRKLRYENKLKDSRGDIAVILDEYARFDRVMLSRLDAGAGPSPAPGEPAGGPPRSSCPRRRTAAFEDMIADLCGTLRFRLRRVAEEACGRAGLFYLVETGEDLFFARAKTLLKEDGHTEIEPLNFFCKAKHPDTDRLLVVIRNEDISLHIHKVPCLLRLKHCPNVVFAGVDSPEDLTGRTYQELFHTGGFVVSDDEVLETVTLGQLKEVVKVLEKLNGSGRWKWLLHYKESKKLREDLRVDANAHKKNLILKSCQGADLIEVLHYHSCDSRSSPKSEYVKCLLNLQVQHISARFAVYLTEKPGLSREVFESQGILVADVNTFLGTVQKVAAPFRRSYW